MGRPKGSGIKPAVKRQCKMCCNTLKKGQEKYCSRFCRGKDEAVVRVTKICEYCGETFDSRIKKKQRFCSEICASKDYSVKHKGKYKVAREDRICLFCGKSFHIKVTSDHRFCSKECGYSELAKKTGENHPFFGKHHTPETIDIIKTKNEARWAKPEEHGKASKSAIKRFENPIERELARQRRLKVKIKNKDTKQELKIQNFLKDKNILFEIQKTGLGHPDIFIEPSICIFCDGDYWHGNPRQYESEQIITFPGGRKVQVQKLWEYDEKITKGLKLQGYTVLRFWEYDVNKNFEKVKATILNTIGMEI